MPLHTHLQEDAAHELDLLMEQKNAAYNDANPQQFEVYTFLLSNHISGVRHSLRKHHSSTNQEASVVHGS